MSKFGETTYDYTGFSPNMDATGIKGEDSNLMEWSSDPEEIVGLLFKGTEGASGGSTRSGVRMKRVASMA